MINVLAYIPFVNPLTFVHEWWYLLIAPLAFAIAVVYKAVRLRDLQGYWRQVLVMTLQIVLGMIALALALTAIVTLIIPRLPVE